MFRCEEELETTMATTYPSTKATPSAAVHWRGVALFIAITFAFSWACFIGLHAAGVPFGVYATIGMFGPALSALITRLILREGFGDSGLRLAARGQRGAWRIYLAAYILIPLILAAGMGLALLVGVQHWALPEHVADLARQLTNSGAKLPPGTSAEDLARLSLIINGIGAFSFILPLNMIATFGEEFGWRGYLLPRLAPLGGVRAALLVGVVWGLWHAPLIVLVGYNYPGHPWAGVGMMVIFATTFSLIFAWLRFRTESVWPSVLAHAALNAQATLVVLALTRGDSLLSAPVGLMGIIPAAAVALWLAFSGRIQPTRSRSEQPAQPSVASSPATHSA